MYLAGPYGFSEFGSWYSKTVKEVLEPFCVIIDPFELNSELGARIIDVQQSQKSLSEMVEELQDINYLIGKNNEDALRSSNGVLALLDGSDVDSGTAAEIGFAYALGKVVYGLRSDFRLAGDNYGSLVNLQVEYFIKNSGGKIFRSIVELRDSIDLILQSLSQH